MRVNEASNDMDDPENKGLVLGYRMSDEQIADYYNNDEPAIALQEDRLITSNPEDRWPYKEERIPYVQTGEFFGDDPIEMEYASNVKPQGSALGSAILTAAFVGAVLFFFSKLS